MGKNGKSEKKNKITAFVFLLQPKTENVYSTRSRCRTISYASFWTNSRLFGHTKFQKKGQWFAGINAGTSAIMDAVRGKFKPLSESEPQPIDISLKHILIFCTYSVLHYLYFVKNNGNGGLKAMMMECNSYQDGKVYPSGFFPGSFGGGFGGGSSGGGFGSFRWWQKFGG